MQNSFAVVSVMLRTLDIWVVGFLGAWVFGCLGFWVLGFLGAMLTPA